MSFLSVGAPRENGFGYKGNRNVLLGMVGIFATLTVFTITYVRPIAGQFSTDTSLSMFSYPLFLILIISLIISMRNEGVIPMNFTAVGWVAILLLLMIGSSVYYLPGFRFVSTVFVWHVLAICTFVLTFAWLRKVSISPVHTVMMFLLIFGLLSLISAWLIKLLGPFSIGMFEFSQTHPHRIHGWFGTPNALGAAIGVAAISGAALINFNFRSVLLYGVIIIVLFVGLVQTGSRGALASSVGAVFIVLSLQLNAAMKAVPVSQGARMFSMSFVGLIGGILFIGLAMVLTALGPDVHPEQFHRSSPFARFEIWEVGLSIVKSGSLSNLLFGHGHLYFSHSVGTSPHNGYLRSIVQYGIIFILVYISFIVYSTIVVVRMHNNNENRMAFLTAGLLVFVISRDFTTPATFEVKFDGVVFVTLLSIIIAWSRNYIRLGRTPDSGDYGKSMTIS